MPIPKPRADESKPEFMDRCVSFVIAEGTDEEQAIAICLRQYESSPRYVKWIKTERKRNSLEIWMKDIIIGGLRQSVQPIVNAKTVSSMEKAKTDPEPLREGLIKAYKRILDEFARDSYDKVAGKVKAGSDYVNFDSWINRWAQETAGKKVKQIDGATLKHIRKAIKKGVEEQEGIDEIARRIKNGWSTSAVRARRIARTEVVGASNHGSLRGAQATGLIFKKEWLSAQDGRTRAHSRGDLYDHLMMDGTQVPDGTFFYLRSSRGNINELQYPGDQSLGVPANIINCRCTLAYVDIKDIGRDGEEGLQPMPVPRRSPERPIKPVIPPSPKPKPTQPKPPKPKPPIQSPDIPKPKPKPSPTDPEPSDPVTVPQVEGDEIGFVEAKSYAEAMEFATDVLGFDEATGYSKADLYAVNQYNKGMFWMQQQFGAGHGGNVRFMANGDLEDTFYMDKNSIGYFTRRWKFGQKINTLVPVIHYNTMGGDLTGWLTAYHKRQDFVNSTYFYRGVKVGNAGAHEYAHYLTDQMLKMHLGIKNNEATYDQSDEYDDLWSSGDRNNPIRRERGAYLKRYIFQKVADNLGITVDAVRKRVVKVAGRYSDTNWHECFAMAMEYSYHTRETGSGDATIDEIFRVTKEEVKRLRAKTKMLRRYKW